MSMLVAAALAFLLLHLIVSGTAVRDALVGRLGEGPYMGLFSLASVVLLIWLIWSFAGARHAAGDERYWSVTEATRLVQIVATLAAFLLIVPGLTTPNPTSVRQQNVLDRPDAVGGMLRITRHPFLWGVAIWAAGHLMVDGDRAGLVLFGTMLVLALLGTMSIDAKRKRVLGPKWEGFAARTSNVPFAAILSGRQKLSVGEIGLWRLALAVALWAGIAWAHPWLFGARALP
jgi:uncharacterized membrane protein